MPIGVIVNSCAVLFGGVIGAALGDKVPERLRISLPLTSGVASMSMGIISMGKIKTMPAVILAIIIGTVIGELIKLESRIAAVAGYSKKYMEKLFLKNKTEIAATVDKKKKEIKPEDFMQQFVAIVILFCASGTGIFGALNEGMTGDHSILFTKSILDLFTSAIFATSLGFFVSAICIPQIVVLMILFFSASVILPFTTPTMIADFTACGGIIMFATGFRISNIKNFPIANMLPALVLVMPISHLWTTLVH
ncbi:DUF554 domain-containing protein [Clostridium felsineum]|uniref:DUF554 domain-containing protein n=1 Tax=Clostridium felsineum TaxID=36839 RepID=UPI00098BCFEF|nr:DUF554 domain-containing protein [Clostridium felsineum]URZ16577.1 hypothetical protein CLFE_026240 [Clostridium felsineum DSM 794]